MKVALLHCYSATNAGDGLLVIEAIDLIREAFPDAKIDVSAQHPDTFEDLGPGVVVLDGGFSPRGPGRDWLRMLRRLDEYDLVVGVGGGYLRAGHPREALVTALTRR
ncbi:MAG: hypothetical protein LCH77_01170 [Actinobacteria bacterium]|mgnify:CR=1 FL=1|nr:hypothetical protein [Actinomycetota bacterium]